MTCLPGKSVERCLERCPEPQGDVEVFGLLHCLREQRMTALEMLSKRLQTAVLLKKHTRTTKCSELPRAKSRSFEYKFE